MNVRITLIRSKKLELTVGEECFLSAITCLEHVGKVTDIVLNLVQQHEIDLVVVGTHTNKGLVKLVLGNHVAELIDIAKPPLLIVPAEVRYKEIQKIAVALNDQDRDLSILNLVSEFAEKLNVELFVFGVAEPQKQTMKR